MEAGCLDFPASLPPVVQLDFDATLGFPGEGPVPLIPRFGPPSWGLLFPWIACCSLLFSSLLSSKFPSVASTKVHMSLAAMAFMIPGADAVLLPRNQADSLRAAGRSLRPVLRPGRPVTATTTANRDLLYEAFAAWCGNLGIDLVSLLQCAMQNLDELNTILCKYGRELYEAGRPYGHYAETVNAIAHRRPSIRRHLQQAWDYAFAWVKSEPPIHHTALPFQVLLAVLSTSLLWGWLRFAGVIALTWGAVLRIGETLKSKRKDLLLPEDFSEGSGYALLAIAEAKTRFSSARHQTAKLDVPDLVQVVSLAFRGLDPDNYLWPYSGSTLRLRFKSVLQALGLPSVAANGVRPLDLGSLRAGGATWMLSVTENSELVRRRGRWLTGRIMEIYLQETSAIMYVTSLTYEQRTLVLQTAEVFLAVLKRAEQLVAAKLPSHTWYRIYCNS